MNKNDEINTPKKANELISDEISNVDIDTKLYNTVKQIMVRGPYVDQDHNSPCMDKDTGKCTENYPNNAEAETIKV